MRSIGPALTPLVSVDPTLLLRQLHRDDNLRVSERDDARASHSAPKERVDDVISLTCRTPAGLAGSGGNPTAKTDSLLE